MPQSVNFTEQPRISVNESKISGTYFTRKSNAY